MRVWVPRSCYSSLNKMSNKMVNIGTVLAAPQNDKKPLGLVLINRSAGSLHAEPQGEPESPYPSLGPRVVEDTLRKEQPQKLAY